jgi:hypothetical protein
LLGLAFYSYPIGDNNILEALFLLDVVVLSWIYYLNKLAEGYFYSGKTYIWKINFWKDDTGVVYESFKPVSI